MTDVELGVPPRCTHEPWELWPAFKVATHWFHAVSPVGHAGTAAMRAAAATQAAAALAAAPILRRRGAGFWTMVALDAIDVAWWVAMQPEGHPTYEGAAIGGIVSFLAAGHEADPLKVVGATGAILGPPMVIRALQGRPRHPWVLSYAAVCAGMGFALRQVEQTQTRLGVADVELEADANRRRREREARSEVAVDDLPEIFDAPAAVLSVIGVAEGDSTASVAGSAIWQLKADHHRATGAAVSVASALEDLEAASRHLAIRDRTFYEIAAGGDTVLMPVQVSALRREVLGRSTAGAVVVVRVLAQDRLGGEVRLTLDGHHVVLPAAATDGLARLIMRLRVEPLALGPLVGAVIALVNPARVPLRRLRVGLALGQVAVAVVLQRRWASPSRTLRRVLLLETIATAFLFAATGFRAPVDVLGPVPGSISTTALAVIGGHLWDDLDGTERVALIGSAAVVATMTAVLYRSPHPIRRVVGDLGWSIAAFAGLRTANRSWARHRREMDGFRTAEIRRARRRGHLDGLVGALDEGRRLVDLAHARLASSDVDADLAARQRARLRHARSSLGVLRLRVQQEQFRSQRPPRSPAP